MKMNKSVWYKVMVILSLVTWVLSAIYCHPEYSTANYQFSVNIVPNLNGPEFNVENIVYGIPTLVALGAFFWLFGGIGAHILLYIPNRFICASFKKEFFGNPGRTWIMISKAILCLACWIFFGCVAYNDESLVCHSVAYRAAFFFVGVLAALLFGLMLKIVKYFGIFIFSPVVLLYRKIVPKNPA